MKSEMAFQPLHSLFPVYLMSIDVITALENCFSIRIYFNYENKNRTVVFIQLGIYIVIYFQLIFIGVRLYKEYLIIRSTFTWVRYVLHSLIVCTIEKYVDCINYQVQEHIKVKDLHAVEFMITTTNWYGTNEWFQLFHSHYGSHFRTILIAECRGYSTIWKWW